MKKLKNNFNVNKKIIILIIIAICTIVAIAVTLVIVNIDKNNKDIIEISENQTNQLKELTEKSEDSSLGMRFTFNVEQFEKEYINTLKENFNEYQNMLNKEQIDTNFFKNTGSKYYEFNQTAYDDQNQLIKYFSILIQPESKESNYIDFIQVNAITETSEDILKFAEDNIFYAFMSVDNSINYEKAKNIYYEMSMSENNYISNGNVTFAFDNNSSIDCTIINIYPFTAEQYITYLDNQNTNSTDIAGEINDALSYLNNDYSLEFEPTDEQMNEIIEFYNSTEDFNNDSLLEFILQKGWIVRGNGNIDNTGINNSNSTKQNNSNSQGQANNSNTSTNQNDDTFKRDLKVTLDINLEQLIAKNETAKEIVEKYPTIFIHVSVEDTDEYSETFEYYGGGKSIPNRLTTEWTIVEGTAYFMGIEKIDTFKDRSEKRKVKIRMDNTSTMIVETILFEGEMVFDKAGTYEIK